MHINSEFSLVQRNFNALISSAPSIEQLFCAIFYGYRIEKIVIFDDTS